MTFTVANLAKTIGGKLVNSIGKNRIVNEKELRIFGLQRSGNHAIINWILSQSQGRAFFLGDVGFTKNPYVCMSEFEHYESGRFVKRIHFYDQNSETRLKNTSYFQELKGKFSNKKLLLYNIEDCPPSYFRDSSLEKYHDSWVGKSRERYDVLIVRDPFNFFASRLKAGAVLTGIENVDDVRNLWKDYAKEYLGETNFLPHKKIKINFNQWFSSSQYRKLLADRLRLDFTDRGLEAVRHSSWSSFDGSKFDGKAQEMQVLQRWKDFSDHISYKNIFCDKELLDLSERIFGVIEGTEMLAPGENRA